MNHDQKVPTFVRVIVVGAVVLIVGVVVAAFTIQGTLRARQQESCERTVQARDDNRTMWLYVLDQGAGNADAEQIAEFNQALNLRLPPLICVDRQPVPVEDE